MPSFVVWFRSRLSGYNGSYVARTLSYAPSDSNTLNVFKLLHRVEHQRAHGEIFRSHLGDLVAKFTIYLSQT